MEIKVPFYNIVNIFLPGMVLIGSCFLLFLDKVKMLVKAVTDLGSTGLEVLVTVSLFAIAYETGYILFRLGSMIIQPMLEIMFGQTEYTDFIAAENTSEKAHTKLETLSREYVYARTQITLFIALVALTAIQSQWWIMCVCIMCVSLFIMSARGYMKRIKKAVTQYLATINSYSEAASNGE